MQPLWIDQNRDGAAIVGVLRHLRNEPAHMRGLHVWLLGVVVGEWIILVLSVSHSSIIPGQRGQNYHQKVRNPAIPLKFYT